jgi:hypothetical protein
MKLKGFERSSYRMDAAPRGLQASNPRTRCRQEAGGTCADGNSTVAVDGEELSPDGEEPSPDRRRTTRSEDACAQSKTVLQDQAGSV